MLGRTVQHLLMGRVAQERAALHAAAQGLGEVRDVTPVGHEPADRQAPRRIAMVNHPIVPLQRGELWHDSGQMGGPIRTGTRVAEMPQELPRGAHERGQQGAHAMAHVRVLALFRFPRVDCLGGGTVENLPPRFCVSTDNEAPLLAETERRHRELTESVGRGLAVGIVAVEPVDAPRRFEVGLLQEAPETGATHGLRPRALREGGDQIIQTPPGSRTRIRGGLLGGHRQHINPSRGGKRAVGDPPAAPLAGQ